MRAPFLTLPPVSPPPAQSPPAIIVIDENGVAVSSARIFLQSPSLTVHCLTDFAGRCQFPALPAGHYQLRVEKQGFYALVEPNVQITPASALEISISHQQEDRESKVGSESSAYIDPAQSYSQETRK